MSDKELSYDCPKCKVPLLVGPHWMKIDRERLKQQQYGRIEAAARDLLQDCETYIGDANDEHVLVDSRKLNALQKSLFADEQPPVEE